MAGRRPESRVGAGERRGVPAIEVAVPDVGRCGGGPVAMRRGLDGGVLLFHHGLVIVVAVIVEVRLVAARVSGVRGTVPILGRGVRADALRLDADQGAVVDALV